MPLAYGNTVVFKASEESPATHLTIAEIFHEAGFPNGVINAITNSPADAAEVVDELIAHPKTRRINFTGSTRVGRIIAEKAGQSSQARTAGARRQSADDCARGC